MTFMALRWEIYVIYEPLYGICDCQGGRTRQLCDQLAECGYMVILPDFFHGEWKVSESVYAIVTHGE